MYICEGELGLNVKKYLDMALSEDVYIMIDSRPKIVISATKEARGEFEKIMDSLTGSLEYEGDIEELLYEKRMEDYMNLC